MTGAYLLQNLRGIGLHTLRPSSTRRARNLAAEAAPDSPIQRGFHIYVAQV